MTDILKTFEELKQELESDDFYCEVGFASTVSGLWKRLQKHSATQKLIRMINADPDSGAKVVDYASTIAHNVTGAVRSENDAALCACLVALVDTGLAGVDDLFEFLRSTSELALWWPSRLVQEMTEGRPSTILNPEQSSRSMALYFEDREVLFNCARAA